MDLSLIDTFLAFFCLSLSNDENKEKTHSLSIAQGKFFCRHWLKYDNSIDFISKFAYTTASLAIVDHMLPCLCL